MSNLLMEKIAKDKKEKETGLSDMPLVKGHPEFGTAKSRKTYKALRTISGGVVGGFSAPAALELIGGAAHDKKGYKSNPTISTKHKLVGAGTGALIGAINADRQIKKEDNKNMLKMFNGNQEAVNYAKVHGLESAIKKYGDFTKKASFEEMLENYEK